MNLKELVEKYGDKVLVFQNHYKGATFTHHSDGVFIYVSTQIDYDTSIEREMSLRDLDNNCFFDYCSINGEEIDC